MNNLDNDNPWNGFLSTNIDIPKNHCKTDKYLQLKEKLKLIHTNPVHFVKNLDLVICKKCNVVITKFQTLKHGKRHQDNKFSYLPYSCHEEQIQSTKNTNKNKQKIKNNFITKEVVKKKGSCSKLNKVQSKEVIQDQDDSEFIPKTIVNSDHPLKLKIQLQPKVKDTIPLKISDNIFETFNYPNTKTENNEVNNVEEKKAGVRSLNEFLKQYEKSAKSDDLLPIKSEPISTSYSKDLYQKVQSTENLSKFRKTIITGSNNELTSNDDNIYMVSKNIIPNITNKSILNSPNYSLTFQSQKSENIHNINKNIKVFQNNSNNNHVRISGQRKCVRIQHINEPADSNDAMSDLLITGEKLIPNTLSSSLSMYNPSSVPSVSSLMPDGYYYCNDAQIQQQVQQQHHHHHHHYQQQSHNLGNNATSNSIIDSSSIKSHSESSSISTQKQFQRRLIQNGIISESDITRCVSQKSLAPQCTNDNVVYGASYTISNTNNNINHVNTNNSGQYNNNTSNSFTEITGPNVSSNKRKNVRKSSSVNRDDRINIQNNFHHNTNRFQLNDGNVTIHSGNNGMKSFFPQFYNNNNNSHSIVHQSNSSNNLCHSKNKSIPTQLSYPVVKQQIYHHLHANQNRSSSYLSSQPPNITISSSSSSSPLSTSSYQHQNNNNNSNLLSISTNNVQEENISNACQPTPPPPKLSSPYYPFSNNGNNSNGRFVTKVIDNVDNNSTTELSEDEFLLDNHCNQLQLNNSMSSANSNNSLGNSLSNTMGFIEKEPIENLHYLPVSSSHRNMYHSNTKNSVNSATFYQTVYSNKKSNINSNNIQPNSTKFIPQSQMPQHSINTYNIPPPQTTSIVTPGNRLNSRHYDICQQEPSSITSSNGSSSRANSIFNSIPNDTEVISHGTDSRDSGIHILPSPGKKIIDLPWDMF